MTNKPKLYLARISCKLKSAYLEGRPVDTLFSFAHAVAAEDLAGANVILQSTFPWTFYKHVKVSWEHVAVKS